MLRFHIFHVVIAVFIFAQSTIALASCSCQCVNGEVTAICSSTLDIEPICSPRICPLDSPSIKPLDSLSLPPLGTSSCSQERVYNEDSGKYEWEEVCN